MPPTAARHLERVAMVSMHTSPLAQPGTGDAGGLNVYVAELSRRLAHRGIEVDVLTRATSSDQAAVVPLADGVQVRHLVAGPAGPVAKEDLPAVVRAFTEQVLRTAGPPAYDVVHSHYWLSGQVGLACRDHWDVPLVHSAHTLARVKDATPDHGAAPEPDVRVAGERAVVAGADRLVANTDDEAASLVELYGADPRRVDVVAPGVDLDVFAPQDPAAARLALGLPPDAVVLTFVGRVQPLKAPDVLLRAAAVLLGDVPSLRDRLVVAVVGGSSGAGHDLPGTLADLARELGIDDVVRLVPPCSRADLARWYAASTVLSVPSYSESFGLVALEAQACGTPVVAARVGGLPVAVEDGVGGVLVDGHDPVAHAHALAEIVRDPARRAALSRGAVAHAARFGWDRTADGVLASCTAALAGRRAPGTMAS